MQDLKQPITLQDSIAVYLLTLLVSPYTSNSIGAIWSCTVYLFKVPYVQVSVKRQKIRYSITTNIKIYALIYSIINCFGFIKSNEQSVI